MNIRELKELVYRAKAGSVPDWVYTEIKKAALAGRGFYLLYEGIYYDAGMIAGGLELNGYEVTHVPRVGGGYWLINGWQEGLGDE